mmetsp:Transcript_10827/g.31018  ORF Transcript_10827/g.31018 Transcript_10827/m.31018 type:complete len:531 (+) Transcript_10827:1858-3450(+)
MATNNKYDRQLRLWGAKGQQALGETTVVLLRATAAGTETLKNLVLPGVGHFHVVDDVAKATHAEVASNFFLSDSDSRSRAEVACSFLRELNPDVKGTFQHVPSLSAVADWNEVFNGAKAETSKQIIVIASDLEPSVLEAVSSACRDGKIPVLAVSSYGLIGTVRLQAPILALMDPKPTTSPPDLRLKNSFPALDELAASIKWDELKDHEHGHIPYPLILHKVAQEWKTGHDGNLPKTMDEKAAFRKAIESMSRGMDKELNFQEATQNAYLAYTERECDYMDELLGSIDASSKLGLLLGALQKFMTANGRPPLNGSIPDMTASTEIYVKLQSIYKDQATSDFDQMKKLLNDASVSDEDLSTFCANVFSIGQLKTRTMVDEFNSAEIDEELVEDWNMATFDPYEVPEHTPLLWYLGFRACQMFFTQNNNRYPGTTDDWKSDIPKLQSCIAQVAKHYRLAENDLVCTKVLNDAEMKMAHEFTRYANAEIHVVASVIGGVASQEAVKIITGQYIPLDNTYVFNGIVSVSGVYRF